MAGLNYSDPRLQRLLLRSAGQNPSGGIANKIPGMEDYLKRKEERNLAMSELGLRSQLQAAQIEQMKFSRGVEEQRLGLSTGYLGLAQQGQALKERQFGIQEKEFGLKEKNYGLEEQRVGLAGQEVGLRGQEINWRNKQFMTNINEKENELNLASALGVGIAGWSAYEGNRRADEIAKDKKRQMEFMDRMESQGYLQRRTS